MKKILMVVALLILALVGYKILKPKHSDNNAPDTVSNTTAFERILRNLMTYRRPMLMTMQTQFPTYL